MLRRHALAAGLVLPLTRRAYAEDRPADASPDALARWIAGMRPWPGAEPSAEWSAYARAEDERWRAAEARRKAMAEWSARQIAPVLPHGRTLFYPFAGPDAVHALALFGAARRMILVGLEPVGALPEPARVPAGYFTRLGGALADVFRLTFFRTKEMASDFERDGVLGALVATIARSGGTVTGVQRSPAAEGQDAVRARIDWVHPDGQARQLDYARADLSNAALLARPELLASVAALAPVVTFVKAAMYLLAEARFSRLRQAILDASGALVQDDTGVPLRHLDARWAVRLFGRYEAPASPFEARAQEDLRAAFERRSSGPLPFGIGYHVRPDRSNLLIASKGA